MKSFLRPVLVLCALLVTAVGLLVAIRSGETQPPDAPGPRSAVRDAGSALVGESVQAPAAERIEIPPSPAAIRVITVDATDGSPVAGARYSWIPRSGAWFAEDPTDSIGATDSAGILALPLPAPSAQRGRILVVHDDHLAAVLEEGTWNSWTDGSEVRLQRAQPQLVFVHNAVGRAVEGVQVIAATTKLHLPGRSGTPVPMQGRIASATTDASGEARLSLAAARYWPHAVPPVGSEGYFVRSLSVECPRQMPTDPIRFTMSKAFVAGAMVVGDSIASCQAALEGVSTTNGGQEQLAALSAELVARHSAIAGARVDAWVGFPKGKETARVRYSILLERSGWLVGTLAMQEYSSAWTPSILDASTRPAVEWGHVDVDGLPEGVEPLLRLEQDRTTDSQTPRFTARISGSGRIKVPPGRYSVRAIYREDERGLECDRIEVGANEHARLRLRLRPGYSCLRLTVRRPEGASLLQGCGMQLWIDDGLDQTRLLQTETVCMLVPAGKATCRIVAHGFAQHSVDVDLPEGRIESLTVELRPE